MSEINELILDTGSWAEKTFPKSTELSVLKHMQEEFNELIEAINPEDKAEEAADVLLLLCHYCYKNKIDLSIAAKSKLATNKARKWETEINDKGYFKHIEKCSKHHFIIKKYPYRQAGGGERITSLYKCTKCNHIQSY